MTDRSWYEIVFGGVLTGFLGGAMSLIAAVPTMILVNSIFSPEFLQLALGAEQATYRQASFANVLLCVVWIMLKSIKFPERSQER